MYRSMKHAQARIQGKVPGGRETGRPIQSRENGNRGGVQVVREIRISKEQGWIRGVCYGFRHIERGPFQGRVLGGRRDSYTEQGQI